MEIRVLNTPSKKKSEQLWFLLSLTVKGSNAAAGNTVLKKILNTVHSSTGSLHHEPPNIGVTKKMVLRKRFHA
jgi:hypothetical protein